MPPLNLVADFGGGSMLVLLGIVAALYERERSGKGQVIDAAMVDGVSVLAQMMWTMKAIGSLRDERESFLLDGGARSTAAMKPPTANTWRWAPSSRSSSRRCWPGSA
ncbi:coA-transferase III family protein [Mycobacterium kansasii]|uniref:CoA-transferase III family protein n=1 Tax=Mycobacterium kansasii TaxID=1768 RepID=A0A1V3WUJ7_MYCKA|nr:coA-transferase III family protein [Mycobacterium kansasii]